jgi:4-hydroxybenzoate polyprenyltransferase
MKTEEIAAIESKIQIQGNTPPHSVRYFYYRIKPYLKVARLDHWFKNVFMLIGIIIAIAINNVPIDFSLILKGSLAILLACLMSSVNYIINEIYDAQFDRKHPNKKFRSVAAGTVSVKELVLICILLFAAAFTGSYFLFSWKFLFFMLLFFVIGGVFYNIPPIRTKDLPFIDIMGESINNPIRLLLGWFAIADSNGLPLIGIAGYWSFGAMLVTAKRLAEYRYLGDKLILYRPTFRFYNNSRLIPIYFLFILITLAAFIFLGINYNSRLFLLVPFLIIFFSWFSVLTFQKNSIVKEPERVFEKKFFAAYCFLTLIFFTVILLYEG